MTEKTRSYRQAHRGPPSVAPPALSSRPDKLLSSTARLVPYGPQGSATGRPRHRCKRSWHGQAPSAHLSLRHLCQMRTILSQAPACASPLSGLCRLQLEGLGRHPGRLTGPPLQPLRLLQAASTSPAGLPCSPGPGTKPSPAQRLT